MKLIGKILAILLIFAAVYNFDPESLNQILASLTLMLLGVHLLLEDSSSEVVHDLRKVIIRTALFFSIILILKAWFYDR